MVKYLTAGMYFLAPALYCILTCLLPIKSFANNNYSYKDILEKWPNNRNDRLSFIENKGQLTDLEKNPVKELLFKSSAKDLDIYITTWGISYVFIKVDEEREESEEKSKDFGESDKEVWYSRTDMELVGATIKKENIIKEYESEDYYNYYLGHCPDGITEVYEYKKIIIQNIYPGIDWVIYSKEGKGIKYDYIVHPGADPSKIRMRYRWAKDVEVKADQLVIKTPLGEINEGEPISYQSASIINTHYKIYQPVIETLTGSEAEVGFKIGLYDQGKTLVIDPELVWATYYGGTTSYDGPYDIDVKNENVWVTGYTWSFDFPTQNPGGGAFFQGGHAGGGYDAMILKFDTSGIRRWATYYGGNDRDEARSISSDGTNIWVVGFTKSSNFPTKNPGGAGYYQDTISTVFANNTDMFILSFTNNGIRRGATYYGGRKDEIAYSVSCEGSDVWITGFTASDNMPVKDPGGGAYYKGNIDTIVSTDIFIIQMNTLGVLKWATYYGGNGSDQGKAIYNDGNYIWITGLTGSSDFEKKNPGGGAYMQETFAGNTDLFILKFDTARSLQWSTYYGGLRNDIGFDLWSDRTNLWITGNTGSDDFPIYNPGGKAYFQSSVGLLNSDAFILKFDTSGVRKWATRYGGDSLFDEAVSIRVNGASVWITGNTNDDYFPTKNSLDCSPFYEEHLGSKDVFIAQFDTSGERLYATYFGGTGLDWPTGLALDPNTQCVYITGEWTGTSTNNPTVDPGSGAYYQNGLAGGGDDGFIMKFCPSKDSSLTANKIIVDASCYKQCDGSAEVLAEGGSPPYSYYWVTNDDSNSRINNLCAGNYVFNLSDECNNQISDSILIKEPNEILIALISSDNVLCNGDSTGTATVSVSGGTPSYSYLWNSGGTNLTENNLAAGTYSFFVKDSLDCKDTFNVKVLEPLPLVTSISSTNVSCEEIKDGSAIAAVSGGVTPYQYFWNNNTDEAIIENLDTGTYYVIVTDKNDCKDSAGVVIKESPEGNCNYVLFIPSSFSPNDDHINDIFKITGSNINEFNLIVYNEFGDRIFQSNDIAIGWNGRHNNKAMNNGVYVYFASGRVSGGTLITRKGNITLIR